MKKKKFIRKLENARKAIIDDGIKAATVPTEAVVEHFDIAVEYAKDNIPVIFGDKNDFDSLVTILPLTKLAEIREHVLTLEMKLTMVLTAIMSLLDDDNDTVDVSPIAFDLDPEEFGISGIGMSKTNATLLADMKAYVANHPEDSETAEIFESIKDMAKEYFSQTD